VATFTGTNLLNLRREVGSGEALISLALQLLKCLSFQQLLLMFMEVGLKGYFSIDVRKLSLLSFYIVKLLFKFIFVFNPGVALNY